MGDSIEDAVAALARLAGLSEHQLIADEHERWRVYAQSLLDEDRRPLVANAIRHEEDGPLVPAVVVRSLEIVDEEIRPFWVSLLPDGQREFAARRAEELRTLERLLSTSPPPVEADQIDRWSQWLQLKLSAQANGTAVLQLLEDRGATKRIRNTARHRLKSPRD